MKNQPERSLTAYLNKNENTLEVLLSSLREIKNPRLKEIILELSRHLQLIQDELLKNFKGLNTEESLNEEKEPSFIRKQKILKEDLYGALANISEAASQSLFELKKIIDQEIEDKKLKDTLFMHYEKTESVLHMVLGKELINS